MDWRFYTAAVILVVLVAFWGRLLAIEIKSWRKLPSEHVSTWEYGNNWADVLTSLDESNDTQPRKEEDLK